MSSRQATPSLESQTGFLTNTLLNAIRQRLPVVDKTLRDYGRMPLWAYLEKIVTPPPRTYQPHEDLAAAVYGYAAELLGEPAARCVSAELRNSPVVLTANHHGADFFAQSVQGTLLFGLRRLGSGAAAATVPVLACGSVPLDNVTYPRGMLLYGVGAGGIDDAPRRLPVFSNRFRRQMVTRVMGFDAAMVRQAEHKAARMLQDGQIAPSGAQPLREILRDEYCAPQVLVRDNYSDQAVILNRGIWRRLFTAPARMPELVYLELEKVASLLLATDLEDPHSLAFALTFEPALRKHLLRELDGARGCWQCDQLLRRWVGRGGAQQTASPQGCGTFLFWGINEAGRRVPLTPAGRGSDASLSGVDDTGAVWEIALEPREIVQSLRGGRLLPSLFGCFLAISLARGVTCAGGYYQADYLPVMQQGVVAALRKRGGFECAAERVARVPTGSYLSGMQAVMCRIADGGLVPAGPLEIIAGGGLGDDDVQRIRTLTVREAHVASLFETVPDAVPDAAPSNWKARLAKECDALLGGKVVVK